MMVATIRRGWRIGALCAAAMALLAMPAAGQIPGAIFTTLKDGTAVNYNIYDAKQDVYINGGPQNNKFAGLPDGVYYFQVTNPSGSVLLSTDKAVNRKLYVVNGRIYGVGVYAGLPIVGTHKEGLFDPANQSVPVQLVPFDDTPNPGGEYKVWLIPIGAATIGPGGKQLIFSNSDAKTDNFKVRKPKLYPIGGLKFYDLNLNALYDTGDSPISFWPYIWLSYTLPDGTTGTHPVYVSAGGQWAELYPVGTIISVVEILPSSGKWVQSAPLAGTTPVPANGTFSITAQLTWQGVITNQPTYGLDFGNYLQVTIGGKKLFSPGDVPIPGWKVTVEAVWPDGTIHTDTYTTGPDGVWNSGPMPQFSTYTVTEVVPTCDPNVTWQQVGPKVGDQTGDGDALATQVGGVVVWVGTACDPGTTDLNFTNTARGREGPYGGLTKGFWHNQNGMAILEQDDPGWRDMLNALCLVNADGSPYDVPGGSFADAFPSFSEWIVSSVLGNMAHQLSMQLAAAELNVREGALLVAGGYASQALTGNVVLVLDPTKEAAIEAATGVKGPYTLDQVMAWAAASLCSNPDTTADGPARTFQGVLECILDGVNNDQIPFFVLLPTPPTPVYCP